MKRSKWNEKEWKWSEHVWNWQGIHVKCLPGLLCRVFWFSCVAYRLHFKSSSTNCSAWLLENWKLQGKKKEKKEKSLGLNSHDISKHNYKDFNSLRHADRSTRWHHTQVRCLAQAKKKKKSHNKTPVPESSVHSVKKASTQYRLARSPRSCFTTLQLYTSAVSEHKTHYRAAGRVDRQQSVSAGQTHTGAVITNLILMQNKFFLFLFLIIKTDKYTHSVFLQNLKSG